MNCAKGPRLVLVKHLSRAGYRADRFEMILVTADHAGMSVVRWWTLASVSRLVWVI